MNDGYSAPPITPPPVYLNILYWHFVFVGEGEELDAGKTGLGGDADIFIRDAVDGETHISKTFF